MAGHSDIACAGDAQHRVRAGAIVAMPSGVSQATEVPEGTFRQRRALVVDDDASIRILVSRILTRDGFVVDVVRDGAEAIEMVLQHAYDVIALDLMMPRIDGLGVVKYLTENRPELLEKVIVMTAFGAQALASVCPPVARFLEKPFDVQRLLAEAADCVGGEGEGGGG